MERQVEDILGRPVPLAVFDTIHRRAEGNPFFVEELLAAEDRGDAVPATIADALLHRVDALSPVALHLAQVLAVAGRPLPGAELVAAAGLSEGEALGSIREAVAANVVTVTDGYALRHALPAGGGLRGPPARRAARPPRRHGPSALEGAGASRRLRLPLACGGRGGIRTGRLARRRSFGEARVRLHPGARPLRAGARPLAGARPARSNRRPAGDRRSRRADRRLRPGGRALPAGLEAVDAGAHPELAATLYERLGDAQFIDDEAALTSYRRALSLVPATDASARSRLLGAEARTLTHLLRWEEAYTAADDALRLALDAGTQAEEVRARMTLGITLAFLGSLDAGEQQLREAQRVSTIAGRPDDLAHTELYLAEILPSVVASGRPSPSWTPVRSAQTRLGLDASFGVFMRVNAAEDLFRLGRWDEAELRLRDCARRPVKLVAEVMQHAVAAPALRCAREAERATAQLDLARAACERGVAAEFFSPGSTRRRRSSRCGSGVRLDAGAEVRRGLALIGDQAEPLYTPALYVLGLRAAADARPASHDRADALLRELAALADPAPPITVAHVATGPVPSTLGSPAARRPQPGRPPPRRGTASNSVSRCLRPLAPGRGDPRIGRSALGRRRPLRLACATAAALRGRAVARRDRRAARASRIALTDAAPVRPPEPLAGGLSPREHEVLELLAEGMTNRQIAERLFISERTAGVHVSRILGKLDARNRVMAARIGRQLGLVNT